MTPADRLLVGMALAAVGVLGGLWLVGLRVGAPTHRASGVPGPTGPAGGRFTSFQPTQAAVDPPRDSSRPGSYTRDGQ